MLAAATLVLSACGGSSNSASSSGGGSSFGAYDEAKAGGVVTFVAAAAGGTLDPKINYTAQYWQLYQATYDGLLGFKYADDAGSFEIVPNLAEALPVTSNGGKTLTFKLRKGIMFSDGNEVTVNDVKASFERIFKVSSPTAGGFYNGCLLYTSPSPRDS